jgi:predicted nucleic acid-binding protein
MQNRVIVDTSLALKWVLAEEDSGKALVLFAEWAGKQMRLLVPALFAYEATNVIYQYVRKGKMTIDRAKEALAEVSLLVGSSFHSPDPALSLRAMELAHEFGLPATYDPHYLALAEREGCEYWTADARLWNAVKDKLAWVRWLGNYQPPPSPAAAQTGTPGAP